MIIRLISIRMALIATLIVTQPGSHSLHATEANHSCHLEVELRHKGGTDSNGKILLLE